MSTIKNIFDKAVCDEVIARINKLDKSSQPLWGTMSVDKMLAHCNVTYEMVFDKKHPKPGAFKTFLLKTFVKGIVVSEKPYKKNSRTAPEFVITNERDFELEKNRLINYLIKAQSLGVPYFDELESHSFGMLYANEWNNMFYKHLDYHLQQFGV